MRKIALNLTQKHKQQLLSTGKIAVIVFLVFSTLLFFVGPPIVKSFVAKKIGEKIGRKVDFGEVNINPFTLSATIGGNQLMFTFVEIDQGHDAVRIGLETV